MAMEQYPESNPRVPGSDSRYWPKAKALSHSPLYPSSYNLPSAMYRVRHHASDLGWADFDFAWAEGRLAELGPVT